MAASLALGGCGYRWQPRSALLDGACLRVFPFEEARPTGIALAFAAHLQRGLNAEGLRPCAGAAAGAELDGEVAVSARRSFGRAGVLSWRLLGRVRAQLTLAGAAEPVWQGNVEAEEDYLTAHGVGEQPLLTEANRRTALARLAERLAGRLQERLAVEIAG